MGCLLAETAAAGRALTGPDAALLSHPLPASHSAASRLVAGSIGVALAAGAAFAAYRRWAAAKQAA